MNSSFSTAHHAWSDIPRREVQPGIKICLIEAEEMTMCDILFDRGATHDRHSHRAEQIVTVLEGALRVRMGDDEQGFDLRAGEVVHVPSEVPHAVEAIEDTHAIEVSSPAREDLVAAYRALA